MSPEVHRAAAVGFQRGADAYRRGRPDYPPEAIDFVVHEAGIGPGRQVLDLAAGTGALTRSLVETGAWVAAAEPIEAMRSILAASVHGAYPCAAVAEALPFANGTFDAVTVAQAFHWFDASRARDEVRRVLRGRGHLVAMWNVRDDDDPLHADLTALMQPYREATPSHRGEAWRAAFDGSSGFEPLERSSFSMVHRVDPDGLVDRVLSVSFMAALEEAERTVVEQRVRTLAGDRAEIVLPYRTEVWATTRTD